MKGPFYETIGWSILIISVIFAIMALFTSFHLKILQRGCDEIDFFSELVVKGIIPAAIALLVGIPHGRTYLKIADKKVKENRLTFFSLILSSMAIALVLLYFLLGSIFAATIGADPLGMGILAIFFIWPVSICYLISIILLIINRFIKKQ